jgi:hypothetical protein
MAVVLQGFDMLASTTPGLPSQTVCVGGEMRVQSKESKLRCQHYIGWCALPRHSLFDDDIHPSLMCAMGVAGHHERSVLGKIRFSNGVY